MIIFTCIHWARNISQYILIRTFLKYRNTFFKCLVCHAFIHFNGSVVIFVVMSGLKYFIVIFNLETL